MKKILILLLFPLYVFAQVPALNERVRTNTLSPSRVGAAFEAGEVYTASGTDTYTVSISVTGLYSGSDTYASGDQFTIIFTNANTTTTPTLNVNSEGAKTIVNNKGGAVAAGDVEGVLKLAYDGTNFRIVGGVGSGAGISREFNREWNEEIDFNKNEIYYTAHALTDDVFYEVGTDNLVDESSMVRQILVTDGTHTINFGSGFTFIYGIQSGEVLEAGTYEVYFLYVNGQVSVNFPGVSLESSTIVQLPTPTSFAAVADGETEIDLTWSDQADESSYQIDYSANGVNGWVNLTNPAADAVSYSHTGLDPGETVHYRIMAIGNGTSFSNSSYALSSATTENSGDSDPPEFTFAPVNSSSTQAVNYPIVITADEAIRNDDGSEITNANVATRITLKETNSSGSNIAFTATIDVTKKIVTIRPATMYGASQLVYVAIDNVEDANGNEVSAAESITFTTTDFTYLNGTSNHIPFGDILDALWAANNTNFVLEATVKIITVTGNYTIVGKYNDAINQKSFYLIQQGDELVFGWFNLTGGNHRIVSWDGVLTFGEHKIELIYNGAVDTNGGLDRVTLEIDDVVQGGKTMISTHGTLPDPANSSASLTVGALTAFPGGTMHYGAGEIKSFIVRSNSGATVEMNIPVLRDPQDTSGNNRHGTWVE